MNKYKTQNTPDSSVFSTKNVILRELGSGKTILDVGCNDGYFGKFDNKNIYYGIDYSKQALNQAKKNYKAVSYYDLNLLKKLPWTIKFDLLIFADVLEHLYYPKKTLAFFLKNYLKKNGVVVISLPNIANWQVRVNILFGKFEYTNTGIMDKTHLFFYTFKSATDLLTKNHLKITKVSYGASLLGPIIRLFPILKSLLATNIIITAQNDFHI